MSHILGFPCKDNFLSLLIRIRIKALFHWKAHSFIVFKSLFKSLAELRMSWTTENREVSSATSLAFQDKSRIIMDIVLNLEELLYLLQSKKMFVRLELLFVSYFSKNQSVKSFNKFPDIPFWDGRTPSCHTLSKAFELSRKTLLFSSLASNASDISCVIDIDWLIHEPPDLNQIVLVKLNIFI